MIEATEQVLSDAPAQGRRRSATVTGTRVPKNHLSAVKKSLSIERTFSDPRIKPFDQLEWERRTAEITDDAGKVVFKQENVEVPKGWSLLATKVVVSKYFYGVEYSPRDIRLGLVEASHNKIGTPADEILLFCFHYDPATGKYGAVAMNLLRITAAAFLLVGGMAIVIALRRDARGRRSMRQAGQARI